MKLSCIGVNHHTAPIELREHLAISPSHLHEEARSWQKATNASEVVVLSTCNRTEFYFVQDATAHDSVDRGEQFLLSRFGDDLTGHFYHCEEADVARHLCRVVSGLDSMVLGETEIFGQAKEAYRQALEGGLTGKVLNRLFQRAFTVGKKVRSGTSIQQGSTSVGSVAVDLAEKIFGRLKGTRVMVIGAGEMSRQTAQALKSRGASSVFVTNRSIARAQSLATEMGGRAVHFDDWQPVLAGVDVVISSTSAPHFVVHPWHVESVRRVRKFRPLFLVDIAVPRDIDPEVGHIEEVYLYDIDTLEQIAQQGRGRREEQVRGCEEIIADELATFDLHPKLPST